MSRSHQTEVSEFNRNMNLLSTEVRSRIFNEGRDLISMDRVTSV